MADVPSLGSFFGQKSKKKIKGNNLNNAPTKTDGKKPKAKEDEQEEGWEEEQVAPQMMKVEVAGKLIREEDKKEEEDTAAPAWSNTKGKSTVAGHLNEKKFPSLHKANNSVSSINIDDGISTAHIGTGASKKNTFAALDEGDDDDDNEPRRPKAITPALVQKKKGEREKEAVKREVDKWAPTTAEGEAPRTAKKDAAVKAEEDDDDEEAAAEEVSEKKRRDEEKKAKKREIVKEDDEEEKEEEEHAEDLKIPIDNKASKDKYKGRRRLPLQDLPLSEISVPSKENKNDKNAASSKKKNFFIKDEGKKKNIVTVEEDSD